MESRLNPMGARDKKDGTETRDEVTRRGYCAQTAQYPLVLFGPLRAAGLGSGCGQTSFGGAAHVPSTLYGAPSRCRWFLWWASKDGVSTTENTFSS